MKLIYSKTLIILLVAVLSLSVLTVAADEHQEELKDFVKVEESNKLALYVNKSNTEIAVVNKSNGIIWWSNPAARAEDVRAKGIFKMQMSSQLMVEYSDPKGGISKINSFVSSVREENFEISDIKNGVMVVYKFSREGFVIPVCYSIENDYMKVEVITSEIKEDSDFKILNIAVLPYFGAGSIEESGYMMVPDGSGALIGFNNGKEKYNNYSQRIYGKDSVMNTTSRSVTEQQARLPVFGLKKGSDAFVAVIGKGESLATVKAYVSGMGTSYNNVYCDFSYREMDSIRMLDRTWGARDVSITSREAVKLDTLEVRYYFLEQDNSDYSGMASRYRKYLIEEHGMKKSIKQHSKPLYLNVYGGIVKKKYIFGLPFEVMDPLTTYSQCVDMVDELRKSGVEDIVVKYNGWMNEGLANKKIPVKVNMSGALGGKQEFNKLNNYMNQNNIPFYPDVDLINFRKSGNGFIRYFDAIKSVTRLPALQYLFKISTYNRRDDVQPWYLLSPLKVEEAARKFTKSFGKLDIRGVSLTTLGSTVYSDYDRNGLDRGSTEEVWERVINSFKDSSSELLFDNANGYAVPYASHLSSVPISSSQFDIEDDSIPFYQIALHGMVSYAIPSVNLSSDTTTMLLKALETGSSLQYSWIGEEFSKLKETQFDYLYSSDYKAWIESAIVEYKKLNKILSQVSDKLIVKHQKLSDGLYETMYENGIRIIVNYNTFNKEVNGKMVEAKGYLVIDGSDAN